MNNLTNIGFPVETEDDLIDLLEEAGKVARPVQAEGGTYFHYGCPSGAELWIQISPEKELIGLNPHFKGLSERTLHLTHEIKRLESPLDGAVMAWSGSPDEEEEVEVNFPFVVDLPDLRSREPLTFPVRTGIQLAAFAQGFDYFPTESDFRADMEDDLAWATRSMVPINLFDGSSPTIPEAYCLLSGLIRQVEQKTNTLTGKPYYWMLIDTLGGEVDLVTDPAQVPDQVQVGGIIHGQFWISGRLLDPKNT